MMCRALVVTCTLLIVSCGSTELGGRHPADVLRDKQLYLCCNLFVEPTARWISDINVRQPLMVSAGTPVTVAPGNRRTRAVIAWDTGTATISHEYGQREESTEEFLRKLLLDRDPRPTIEKFSPLVRRAIAAARVMTGMTRSQVLMAIGHPPTYETASPTMAKWVYFTSSRERVEVIFDQTGTVREIAGLSAARQSILFEGK